MHKIALQLKEDIVLISFLIKKYESGEIYILQDDFIWLTKELELLSEKTVRVENILSSKIVGDMTLQEVADALGITRERVRQIESQAIKKLKHPKVGKNLKDYVGA